MSDKGDFLIDVFRGTHDEGIFGKKSGGTVGRRWPPGILYEAQIQENQANDVCR